MNFRYKCLLQSLFSLFPNSESLNYWAQKHLSKTLPPSREFLERKRQSALVHHKVFEDNNVRPEDSVVYEIGCGWVLVIPLFLSTFHYKHIYALDLHMHVRAELVNAVLQYLRERERELLSGKACNEEIKKFLSDNYSIALLAPCDATMTSFEDNSIDCIYSQEVFEHIPENVLNGIMRECYRILVKKGVISLYINYADHYCPIDKSITPYNFLKYSEKQWRKYNPPLHYVNRLRHSDFVRILGQNGFRVVEENVFRPDGWEDMIRSFPFAPDFSSRYTKDDLSITSAHIVLQKNLS
jgi:SAM-dependent methyltransferase